MAGGDEGMSSYILCQTRRAEKPFYIENISTNIYSIEELCYYLYHNLYLIDQTLVNEDLCRWIEEELSLPLLAAKLRPHLGKFADIEDILYPIFKEINYLTYEELRDLNARLARQGTERLLFRKRRKGDQLMENGMYVNAIRVYRELLDSPELSGEEDLTVEARELLSKVRHNLGCAYTRLFQMDKALECFYQAYETSGRDEDLIDYLVAFRSIRTPIEYESRLTELAVPPAIRRTVKEKNEHFARIPEKPVYSQHVDELIAEITRDYHRSTLS